MKNQSELAELLRDIEFADPNLLNVLFDYKMRCQEENEDEEQEIEKEYRSGMMDPSRTAAIVEKEQNIKKMIGLKQTLLLKQKQWKNLMELDGVLHYF